jgi:cobalamin biosynthesis Co2+ chelatase CbiK
MATRYGYKIHDIKQMTYEDFVEVVEIMADGVKEEFKDQMTLQAFGSWQIIEALKAMFGETKPMNFNKYAKALGLIEENERMTKAQLQLEKQVALSTATEIVKLHKQQGAKMND